MFASISALKSCMIFQGLSLEEIQKLLTHSSIRFQQVSRDEILAFEGDPCETVGIILEGSVHIQRIYPSGKTITIDTLGMGNSFGEAIIFSDQNSYPATIVAAEDAAVAYLSRPDIIRLCEESPAVLNNFLGLLSNKILVLNRRIKSLSYHSVRQKVADFLLEERQRQQNDHLRLRSTRDEVADALGIPRPSLSRELAKMKEAGWIDYRRGEVQIRDLGGLESCLSE